MADDLIATLDLPPDHAVVLPNPLDVEAILAARQHPVRWPGLGPHLLAVGRLAPEKGFDLLLEAFAEVRERFPAADLVIAGSGPEQAALQTQCSRLGLEQAVHFAGHVANPYALFPGATLFVLSSRHEGMPNALLEAVAGGLPVVATPASGGVVELLRELPAAWPAPDISTPALAETLICALQTLEVGRHTHLAIVSSESPVEPDPLHASHGPAPTIRLGSSSAIAAYEELLDSIYATRQP